MIESGPLTYRQSSIKTKPSHTRFKTQTDCYGQNYKSQKQFYIKKPIKKQHASQFDIQNIQNKGNKMLGFKKSPAQNSIFGQINLHMPKFHKHNLSNIQMSHPLKQYIYASKLKNIKKIFVRNHKISCQNFIKPAINLHLSNKIANKSSKFQNYSTETKKQMHNLYKIVDEIYKKIEKFKQVGYTQKKINQWILKYCLHKRKYMTPLLMTSINKHKFSQTHLDYFYEIEPQKVKQKLSYVVKKINGKQRHIDQYDLLQFSQHMQEILIQKNKVKINQLRQSINQKLDECFIYNRQKNQYQFGKKLHPPDMLNFITDMNQIQLRNGRFQNISNFNRQYFSDLGSTQKDIRTKIYQLISITETSANKALPTKINKIKAKASHQQQQQKQVERAHKYQVLDINDDDGQDQI